VVAFTYRGHGYKIDDPVNDPFENVVGGSAPQAGDLVIWTAYCWGQFPAATFNEPEGFRWWWWDEDDTGFSEGYLILVASNVYDAGDLSSPPDIIIADDFNCNWFAFTPDGPFTFIDFVTGDGAGGTGYTSGNPAPISIDATGKTGPGFIVSVHGAWEPNNTVDGVWTGDTPDYDAYQVTAGDTALNSLVKHYADGVSGPDLTIDMPDEGSDNWQVAVGFWVEPTAMVHNLSASSIDGAAPVLDSPSVSQNHALAADGIAVAPVVDAASLSQNYALAASSIDGAAVVLGTPPLSVGHPLLADGVLGAAPVIDAPPLTIVVAITASDLVGAAPVLDTPAMAQKLALGAMPIVGAAPVLDEAAFSEAHALLATSIAGAAAVLDTPPMTLVEQLAAVGISVAPVLDAPALTVVHPLVADGIAVGPVLDAPPMSQVYALLADGIAVAPLVNNAALIVLRGLFVWQNPAWVVPTVSAWHDGQWKEATGQWVYRDGMWTEVG
jgi:hypothetical protein